MFACLYIHMKVVPIKYLTRRQFMYILQGQRPGKQKNVYILLVDVFSGYGWRKCFLGKQYTHPCSYILATNTYTWSTFVDIQKLKVKLDCMKLDISIHPALQLHKLATCILEGLIGPPHLTNMNKITYRQAGEVKKCN